MTQPAEKASSLEFTFRLYDLYTEGVSNLRAAVSNLADHIDPTMGMRGPMNAIIFEVAANALKALYKRAYFDYVLVQMGLDDLPYTDWLKLFRTEIEEHKAENFAHLCTEKGIFIEVTGRMLGDRFRIEVSNEGTPSEMEWKRLRSSLGQAHQLESMIPILEMDREDGKQEGAGLGLPLIILSLRGMGAQARDFTIFTEGDRTIARVDFPLTMKSPGSDEPLRVMTKNKEMMGLVWGLFRQIELSVVRFEMDGTVRAVSRNLLTRLRIPGERPEEFRKLISDRMIQDLFRGPGSVRVTKRVKNYRVYVDTYTRDDRVLFNVSGYLAEPGNVNTLWQEVALLSAGDNLDEGTLTGNLKLHSIIEPYIPQLVMMKAREMAELGQKQLPEEVQEMTVMFADLVGFTEKSERMRPHLVVELLNLAHNVVVRSIKGHGGEVDKFMGDAVMALFPNPLGAVVAAVEIQNNFYHMNEFRREAGEDPIQLRIGINTGSVIMADVGTEERRDWTALGDTVNTASRIEKRSPKGGILVSDNCVRLIRDNVKTAAKYSMHVKGKQEELIVFTIRSVRYNQGPSVVELELMSPDQAGGR